MDESLTFLWIVVLMFLNFFYLKFFDTLSLGWGTI